MHKDKLTFELANTAEALGFITAPVSMTVYPETQTTWSTS